jgi:hypothetical protein
MLYATLSNLVLAAGAAYALFHLFIFLFKKNLSKTVANGPQLTVTHSEMVAMAKKLESEMDEDEWHKKFGAFRIVLHLSLKTPIAVLQWMNRNLQSLEVLMRGGHAHLAKSEQIRAPIFIVGDFRCGTSVMERIVCHHPDAVFFQANHTFVWTAPYLWNVLANYIHELRAQCGCHRWNSLGGEGVFYPHSANNLLTIMHPFELENIWSMSNGNLAADRHYDWSTLDSDENPDNNTDRDLLTEEFEDEDFEKRYLTAIRLLLAMRATAGVDKTKLRFVNKNPLNSYRIGYLRKLFPDAKFIWMRRNPLKGCKSQMLMADAWLRTTYIDEDDWRRADCKPEVDKERMRTDKHYWAYLSHGQDTATLTGNLWFPKQWPRTRVWHQKIQKCLKEGKRACAFATGMRQCHDAITGAIERAAMKEGKDYITVWHEDLVDDALSTARKVFDYCGFDSDRKALIAHLEKEDFPSGKANGGRVAHSSKRSVPDFGDETGEVKKILMPLYDEFEAANAMHEA